MSKDRPKKAVIVAAGMGRRLQPYTDEMPKCLVPVAGRPILLRQLDAFRANGVDEAVIVRGYRADVLERRREELGPGITFVENKDFQTNNILQSLFKAEAHLEGPFLFTYSDIVFARSVVSRLLDAPGDICLVIDRDFASIYEGRDHHPLSEAEVTAVDAAGRVAKVGKRALPAQEAYGEFIGLARLTSAGSRALLEAWRRLQLDYAGRSDAPFGRAPRFHDAYLTDILQHLIDGGFPVTALDIHGEWREIDTVQDLERAARSVDW